MKMRLVMAALLLLVSVIGVGWLSQESAKRSSFVANLSSWSAAPRGGRALFLLCEKLGLDTERLLHDLEVIPEDGTVVAVEPRGAGASFFSVLLGDKGSFTEQEVKGVRSWVEEGHTFVLVSRSSDELYEAFGVELVRNQEADLENSRQAQRRRARRRVLEDDEDDSWPPKTTFATPVTLGEGILADVNDVQVERDAPGLALGEIPEGLTLERGDGFEPLLVTGDGRVVAAQFRVRRGRFVMISSSFMASNLGLGQKDNAQAMVAMLGSDGPLHFDEFHHGFSNDRSLSGYLGASGLWIVVCQLGLLLLLLAWRAQKRFGEPLSTYEDELRGTGDALKAMSHIYQRGGHREHVLAILQEDLQRQLSTYLRLPINSSMETVMETLRQRREEALVTRVMHWTGRASVLLSQKPNRRALVEVAQGLASLIREIPGRNKGQTNKVKDS